MLFSERLGYTPAKLELQLEEIDKPLRNGIWDVCCTLLIYPIHQTYEKYYYSEKFADCCRFVWQEFRKQPMDTLPSHPQEGYDALRGIFFETGFPKFYDLIEIFHSFARDFDRLENEFADRCNAVFEKEKAALRFISGQLSPITQKHETDAVNLAAESTQQSVSKHISRAIQLYSDRNKPDYRNSIKEAISAVQAPTRLVAGDEKASLGQALNLIERQSHLHPALKKGFSNLYGWTNDDNGIRHALLDEDHLTEEDARYMLIGCSAFTNYLAGKLK